MSGYLPHTHTHTKQPVSSLMYSEMRVERVSFLFVNFIFDVVRPYHISLYAPAGFSLVYCPFHWWFVIILFVLCVCVWWNQTRLLKQRPGDTARAMPWRRIFVFYIWQFRCTQGESESFWPNSKKFPFFFICLFISFHFRDFFVCCLFDSRHETIQATCFRSSASVGQFGRHQFGYGTTSWINSSSTSS